MDWTNAIIAICSAIGSVIAIVTILSRKFEVIHNDLRQLDNRISRMEGYLQGRDFKATGSDKQ